MVVQIWVFKMKPTVGYEGDGQIGFLHVPYYAPLTWNELFTVHPRDRTPRLRCGFSLNPRSQPATLPTIPLQWSKTLSNCYSSDIGVRKSPSLASFRLKAKFNNLTAFVGRQNFNVFSLSSWHFACYYDINTSWDYLSQIHVHPILASCYFLVLFGSPTILSQDQ